MALQRHFWVREPLLVLNSLIENVIPPVLGRVEHSRSDVRIVDRIGEVSPV